MSEWKENIPDDMITINVDSIKQNYPYDEIEYLHRRYRSKLDVPNWNLKN